MPQTIPATPDVVLIGAGIMSATLGTMLKELDPSLNIVMLEVLDDCAQESSQAWNNAGTGHAANCELSADGLFGALQTARCRAGS
jgi:malate dehydrogenase (quinone)